MLNKTNWDTKRFLVCLAVDVYNDSLVETLSTKSCLSLSSMYANNILEKFEDKGWAPQIHHLIHPLQCVITEAQ